MSGHFRLAEPLAADKAHPDIEAITQAVREKRCWGDWQRLHKQIGESLKDDGIRQRVEDCLGRQVTPDAYSRESMRKDLTKGKLAGDSQLKAVLLAAGLFGRDFDRWEELFGRGPSASRPGRAVVSRPIRLAIFRTMDIAYTQDIFTGFLTRLGQGFGNDLRLVVDKLVGIDGDLSKPANRETADCHAHELLRTAADRRADYLVAVGTQASVVLRDALGDRFGQDTNFVFLGVTSPRACHLVQEEGDDRNPRQERNRVGGVSYGRGLDGIASWIANQLLAERREWGLKFIYRPGVLQDEQAAALLGNSKLCRDQRLTVCAGNGRDGYAAPADLADENMVFFSWHCFEDMFEQPDLRPLLTDRFVVATTRRNVEDGHAAIGYAADDIEIGRLGAELVIDHFRNPNTPLGDRNVRTPPFNCWVHGEHYKALRERTGFEIPQPVLGHQDTIIFGDAPADPLAPPS